MKKGFFWKTNNVFFSNFQKMMENRQSDSKILKIHRKVCKNSKNSKNSKKYILYLY